MEGGDREDQERRWRGGESLAVQAAALAERVRHLETAIHEIERRLLEDATLRERRTDKQMQEMHTRLESIVTQSLRELSGQLAARVSVDEFRPYKLMLWILGGAVLVAAVPTLSQTFLPAVLKALFH